MFFRKIKPLKLHSNSVSKSNYERLHGDGSWKDRSINVMPQISPISHLSSLLAMPPIKSNASIIITMRQVHRPMVV